MHSPAYVGGSSHNAKNSGVLQGLRSNIWFWVSLLLTLSHFYLGWTLVGRDTQDAMPESVVRHSHLSESEIDNKIQAALKAFGGSASIGAEIKDRLSSSSSSSSGSISSDIGCKPCHRAEKHVSSDNSSSGGSSEDVHAFFKNHIFGEPSKVPANMDSLTEFKSSAFYNESRRLANMCIDGFCPGPQPGNASLYSYTYTEESATQNSIYPNVPIDLRYPLYKDDDRTHDENGFTLGGRVVMVEEIIRGYQILYEKLEMFSFTNFMGVPLQQDPSDAFALMDMIYRIKPDLIIELGTAGGGASFFYAFLMQIYNPKARVITMDPKRTRDWNWYTISKICPHCVEAKSTPLWKNGVITFFNALPETKVDEVKQLIAKWGSKTIMVIEDGNHRTSAVKANIEAYAQFVTPGSYLVVQDTKMDNTNVRENHYRPPTRPKGRKIYDVSPRQAVVDFLSTQQGKNFEVDRTPEYYIYSQHIHGFLKRKGKERK